MKADSPHHSTLSRLTLDSYGEQFCHPLPDLWSAGELYGRDQQPSEPDDHEGHRSDPSSGGETHRFCLMRGTPESVRAGLFLHWCHSVL